MRNIGIGILFLLSAAPGAILITKLFSFYFAPTKNILVRFLFVVLFAFVSLMSYYFVTCIIDKVIFKRRHDIRRWVGRKYYE